MSLKHFHLFFLFTVLVLLALTSAWALGLNPARVTTPWALKASVAGFFLTLPYAAWFLRKAKELR